MLSRESMGVLSLLSAIIVGSSMGLAVIAGVMYCAARLADADDGAMVAAHIFLALLLGLLSIAAYWAPSIVGFVRGVPNKWSVVVINGLLGWTLIGWAVALSMAVRDKP